MAHKGLAYSASAFSVGTAPDLADAATRRRLSTPGFGAFRKLCDALRLTVEQQCTLLGGLPRRTIHRWISAGVSELDRDQLERISLVLGIFKALQILFPIAERRDAWLRSANSDVPFADRSPLDYMLQGSLQQLYETRRYLDAWRGGWP